MPSTVFTTGKSNVTHFLPDGIKLLNVYMMNLWEALGPERMPIETFSKLIDLLKGTLHLAIRRAQRLTSLSLPVEADMGSAMLAPKYWRGCAPAVILLTPVASTGSTPVYPPIRSILEGVFCPY